VRHARGTIAAALAAALTAAPITWCPGARAQEIPYALDLPADQLIRYRIPLLVYHPGTLVIEAEWNAPRVVSLRVEHGESGVTRARRSGPSPQRLEVELTESDLASGSSWSLWIQGLPARQAAAGRIVIRFPSPPAVVTEPAPPSAEPGTGPGAASAPPPVPEPWRLPALLPDSAGQAQARLHAAVERLRAAVIEAQAAGPDEYRWQDDALRFLASERDRSTEGAPALSASSAAWMRRVGETAREVERLRSSPDTILSGPPPEDPARATVWNVLHRQRMLPIERSLDALLSEFDRGLVAELAGQTWIPRFLSCLTICQRHFDERARQAPAPAAPAGLAHQQWASLLSGAEALEGLADLRQPEEVAPEPPVADD